MLINKYFCQRLKNIKIIFALCLTFCFINQFKAQESHNPILRKSDPNFLYLADPAAEVYNGKVYVYCSHDQENAENYTSMQDYALLESSDLKNWTNHGIFLKPRKLDWAEGQMNAPDCAYKNGYYYFYFPYDKTHIGVMKSKTPTGPWEETIQGKIASIFDPTVFVDDDGQAYMYGSDNKVNMGDESRQMWAAKLKDNMLELDGDWYPISAPGDIVSEAVTMFKKDGIYYFMARSGNRTGYWMADSPIPSPDFPIQPKKTIHSTKEGYANFKGHITYGQNGAPDHMSVIQFKKKWYFFYHKGFRVNGGSRYKRSACFEKMSFNDDGTIQQIMYTLDKSQTDTKDHGKGSIHVEAENFSESNNLRQEVNQDIDGGYHLSRLYEDSWAFYEEIDFGENKENKEIPFFVRVSAAGNGDNRNIEIRLDDLKNEPVCIIPIEKTGGAGNYKTFKGTLKNTKGKHTVYISTKGKITKWKKVGLMDFNWFEFTPKP